MDDEVFVSNKEWNNLFHFEAFKKSNIIDGINIYSFATFDSLKEYTTANSLIQYANPGKDHKLDSNKKSYLCKLRDSLKCDVDYKNLEKNDLQKHTDDLRENKSKSEKNQKNQLFDEHLKLSPLITHVQHTINETVTYNYDDFTNEDSKKSKSMKPKCGKEHCSYGCICDTIKNTQSIVRDHCGRYECMFECICNNKRKLLTIQKESDIEDSSSNDDYKPSNHTTRRSKRQKYLSLKAYEYFENDKTKLSIRNNRLETYKQTSISAIKPEKNKLKVGSNKKEKPKDASINKNENTIKTDLSVKQKDHISIISPRLRNKLHKPRISSLNESLRNKKLESSNSCLEVNKFRNILHNRLKSSSKYNNDEKQFKPYVKSIILKTSINNQATIQNKVKSLLTIPLYVEVFTEWKLNCDQIFKKICKIIKSFLKNAIVDWEQIEFDYNDLTVRLCSSRASKSRVKLDAEDKLNPIFVKVLKLNKSEKIGHVEKLKSKQCLDVLNSNSGRQFDKFLKYSSSSYFNLKDSIVPASNDITKAIIKTDPASLESRIAMRSLPRLINRKHTLFKSRSSYDINNKMGNENHQTMGKMQLDTYEDLSPLLYKLHQDDYPKCYYNPFIDYFLIKPLYHDHGRYHVDEVADILNNMIKGVCLYEDHLKSIERKRLEMEEKSRKFFNFTQKILHETKLVSPTGTSGQTNMSLDPTSKYSRIIPNITTQNSIFQENTYKNSNISQKMLPVSSISNKRVTPILPKLPPCIKIISSNSKQLNVSDSNNTIESKNIITKLLSQSSLIHTNQNLETKSVLKASEIIPQKFSLTGSNISIDPATSKIAVSKSEEKPYKTLIKLIAVNSQQVESNNGNHESSLKNIKFMKVSPKTSTDINVKNEKDISLNILSKETDAQSFIDKICSSDQVDKSNSTMTAFVVHKARENSENSLCKDHRIEESVDNESENDPKITERLTVSLIANRKRKRKQDFSDLLSKCVSNTVFLKKLSK